MLSKRLATCLIGIAATCISPPVLAEDDGSDEPAVTLTVVPYAWIPTIDGSVSLGPVAADVRVTPSEIASGLKAGYMGHSEVSRGREFVYADTVWVKQDDKAFGPFFSQPVVSELAFIDVGVGLRRQIEIGRGRSFTVAPHIGIQHLSLRTRVDSSILQQAAKGKWTSPALGAVIEAPLSERFGLVFKGDLAGLGNSDVSYASAALALQAKVGRNVAIAVGYRHASGRYSSPGGLSLDLTGGGPMVGIRFDTGL